MSVKEKLAQLGNEWVELEEKLHQFGVKYEEETKHLEKKLGTIEANIKTLLHEDERTGYFSVENNLRIDTSRSVYFDTENFKQEHPEIYEKARVETKPVRRFNREKLETEYPDFYKKFLREDIRIEIEKIE